MKLIWNDTLASLPEGFISLRKPNQVRLSTQQYFEHTVHAPCATPEQLMRVHSAKYVASVLAGATANGFGNTDPHVLQHILAANGVMTAAVAHALSFEGTMPIFAPVSGFHHAHYADGYGYCTFNGLLVAVAQAIARDPRRLLKVLIIDGDGHYGDGTDDCLRQSPMLSAAVTNLTALKPATWRRNIDRALRSSGWDLVLYQAGADAHERDPCSVGYLTDDDWDQRDTVIARYCAARRIPLVWNLAGGYNGQETIDLHVRTAQSMKRAYATVAGLTRGATVPELKLLEEAGLDRLAVE